MASAIWVPKQFGFLKFFNYKRIQTHICQFRILLVNSDFFFIYKYFY